jgi:hypothetical protein
LLARRQGRVDRKGVDRRKWVLRETGCYKSGIAKREWLPAENVVQEKVCTVRSGWKRDVSRKGPLSVEIT